MIHKTSYNVTSKPLYCSYRMW